MNPNNGNICFRPRLRGTNLKQEKVVPFLPEILMESFRPRLRGTNLKRWAKCRIRNWFHKVSVPDYGELILNSCKGSWIKRSFKLVSVPDYGELILNMSIDPNRDYSLDVSVPDYGELILNLCDYCAVSGIPDDVSVPDYGELILNYSMEIMNTQSM